MSDGKVHPAGLRIAAGGIGALVVLAAAVPVSAAGWTVGLVVPVGAAVLVAAAIRRARPTRFGPANVVTSVRVVLVGLIAALAATALTEAVPPVAVVALAVPALVLDAVDGGVARRTGSVSALGARYDMEVDAFLLLVLGVLDGPRLGWWVLAIGLMRYAFVAAGRLLPSMRATLPPRYWRKVVTAANGIALVAAVVLPPAAASVVVLAALGLLVESFSRDVVWLRRRHRAAVVVRRREVADAGR
jgi:phosphatidylglycerophosphate synthase